MRVLTLLLAVLFSIGPSAPARSQEIVPLPNDYRPTEGELFVSAEVSIGSGDPELAALIPVFARTARKFFDVEVEPRNGAALIELRRDRRISDAEAYRVTIGPAGIVVESGAAQGCFYGLQTLLQLIGNSEGRLPAAVIEDAPRFRWRGLMLDEARHFFGADEIKSILDLMALHKLNRFHWHLTDTTGWRIESERYPRLTEVGAIGNASDPAAPPRFYTQKEIAEIVEYARERFIEVIPEIDMPGHAAAAVRAYPELSGGGPAHDPDFTFNPAKEATYQFLAEVLTEVATLFPPRWMHIGGDEVRLGNEKWGELPEVRTLMRVAGISDLLEVERLFLREMSAVVEGIGKEVVVWDEAVAADLPVESTVIMWWRHNRPQGLRDALARGYRVVLTPRIPMYFDFVQHAAHTHGRKWDEEFVSAESVYRFPTPELTGGVPVDHERVEGIQANLWTDRTHTRERLQFMLYPRLFALAEAAWTREESKEWSGFESRLKRSLDLLDREGIVYHDGSRREIAGPPQL